MTDLRTAAQQALDALGKWSSGRDMDAVELNDLIATLEAALAQQEQEQVAHYYAKHLAIAIWEKHYKVVAPDWRPLPDLMGVLTQIDNMAVGLAPPRREWVSLTDEERANILFPLTAEGASDMEYARAIEQALKERNT